jgi:AhpD family alkylhydroperoxidase
MGASEAEIQEAIALAAATRSWSTYLAGAQIDDATFRAELGKLIEQVKKGGDAIKLADALGISKSMQSLVITDDTAIPCKYKELIQLAVSAQVPSRSAVYAHTEFAKLGGANEQELKDAIAMAGLVRQWSTVLNGNQVDKAAFQKDVKRLLAHAKKMASR